jgi:putative transposase
MSANQAFFAIATMARVLGMSTAGYYAWRSRRPSARAIADDALLRRVRTIHAVSRGTYGVPRVHAELRAEGRAVGKKRIARLMRAAGIVGVSRRRGVTTRRDGEARPAPDLVDRNFTANRPNQLWVADITYVPTVAGFLYLAVVLDAFSRRIVGWGMETHLRTELVLAALEMAIGQRKPSNVIHHSDQGTQYTSLAFGGRCREAGVRPSMGSVGDAYDNAMCESFFATLECELLARRRFTSQAEARMAVSATLRAGTIPFAATPVSAIYLRSPMRPRCSTKPKLPKRQTVRQTGSTPEASSTRSPSNVFKSPEQDVCDTAEGVRFLQDRVEHRREVAGRAVDDFEDFGRRRLLLARLT